MRFQLSKKELFYRVRDLDWLLSQVSRQAMEIWDLAAPTEFARLYRRVRPLTMCSNARLRGLYRAVHYIVANKIPGDVVECGTARGGSAALMALAGKGLGDNRPVWAFDTFEGLPAPTSADPDYEIANLYTGSCVGRIEEVQRALNDLGVAQQVRLVKGLFQETLPGAPLKSVALLHLDCDWYESVKFCLKTLYDKLSPGAVVQLDDYGHWQGARRAVDEFFQERGLVTKLQRIDYSGRQFIAPHANGQPASLH